MSPSVVLGVDFGTSHTVAVLHRPGHAPEPLLFDGSPLLPSAVYAEPDGTLLVGRDAVHSARLRPERFEPNPKRRVDDGTVLLADTEVSVVRLFAAVLERVRGEAERVAGSAAMRTVVTHPAVWGPARRLVLTDACDAAGLAGAAVMAEPVAAARYFARRQDVELAVGDAVVVYDFGGGTFDASVVAATDAGFEVLAVDGLDTLGGVDIDHALVQHLGRRFDGDERWRRLLSPQDATGRRQHRSFVDDVRGAKERLSRQSRVELLVPVLEVDTHLTRGELETICEPLLGKAVRLTQAVMRAAAIPRERIAGVLLVGGASRMPLAATSLHRGVGIAPTVIDQPELVVATGAIMDETSGVTPPPAPTAFSPPAPASATTGPSGTYVTPLVSALAADKNVDLSTVTGTGVGGRIRKQDVLAAAETAPAPTSPAPISAAHQPTAAPSSPTPQPPSVSTVQSPVTPSPPLAVTSPSAHPAGPLAGTGRLTALKVLLWIQFALMSGFGTFTVVIVIAEPPPDASIWIAAIVLGLSPFGFAALTVSNAVRLGREPVRAHRAITIVQTVVLLHMTLVIGFLAFMAIPGPPLLRLGLAVVLVVAGVILGLARPSEPVALAVGSGSPGLRSQFKVQLGLLVPAAAVALWWWVYVATSNDVSFDANPWPVPRFVGTALMSLILLGVLVMISVNLATRRADDPSTRVASINAEWLWLVVVVLCTLPWFDSNEDSRLMPTIYDVSEYEAGTSLGWAVGGDPDIFNELALWLVTASAIPAILALVQLTRTPTLKSGHDTVSLR